VEMKASSNVYGIVIRPDPLHRRQRHGQAPPAGRAGPHEGP
jgi:hypothetical protein